ncbi:sugar isomerase (SIS) [Coriobacterium glomerans PW2]|uniref:Sugar isomerase (SIS) n=1 Tax=Coriobacterium glomerans (strain ATCC 49209 / DSM 20642 / JCM 10262 / PW2) TaxID=700015 RepID=F2N8J9_CORGP|nr:SIS domain-containing protein [Coriobacterium glomerans]AEB07382.1 sugar isomerase (SIS) [Coriobacterium glomerans PW2]
MMSSAMFGYIRETPSVLSRIIEQRASICAPFVEAMRDAPIERIYIIGSGTSFHAGISAQTFIQEVIGCPVSPMYPTHFAREAPLADPRALVIGVSQGGQSLSTVAGLDAAAARGMRTAALSANPSALIFEHAETRIMLEVGEEACGAKTKGYCGSIATLMLMLAELARATGQVAPAELDVSIARMRRVIDNMPPVISEADSWYRRIEADLVSARRIIVVGYDAIYGDVLEGALKILETVRQGVSGYDIEEFFHGIYNSISAESHLFILGSEGAYKARAQRLIEILSEWTPHTHLIADPNGVEAPSERDLIVHLVDDPLFSCWEYILPLQVIACRAAQSLGIDPAIPKDPRFHERIGSKAPVAESGSVTSSR